MSLSSSSVFRCCRNHHSVGGAWLNVSPPFVPSPSCGAQPPSLPSPRVLGTSGALLLSLLGPHGCCTSSQKLFRCPRCVSSVLTTSSLFITLHSTLVDPLVFPLVLLHRKGILNSATSIKNLHPLANSDRVCFPSISSFPMDSGALSSHVAGGDYCFLPSSTFCCGFSDS